MSNIPTFAEFVKAYFPKGEVSKFHMQYIEKISEQIEALKPGQTLILDHGRYSPLYRRLAYNYQECKDIATNGIHADAVIVDECIAMPSRLHEADEPGKLKLKTGGLEHFINLKNGKRNQ